MVTKAVMEEYTKYVDTSEMIIEYYKNQDTSGLEKYFLAIENWLQKDTPAEENRPLVIQAPEGVGKKTLIGQWIKYHQQKSQKNYPDLIIPHFAGTGGTNSNHFYALYKILVRLREHFNIAQKVELLEAKLVHYFHYWLDVSSRALIGKIVDDSTVILIFDSINMFIDPDTGEEANISLWLPATFPYRIKVIVTTEPDSQSLKRFENNGCEIINIEDEPKVHTTIIDKHLARHSYIVDDAYRQKVIEILRNKPQNVTKNALYLKTYLSTLLPYPSDKLIGEDEINKNDFAKIFKNLDFKALEEINDIDGLCTYLLEYFSKNIMPLDKFQAAMAAFTLTEKGLSERELLDFVRVDLKEWKSLIAIFKTFLMKYKGFWKINNQPFKKAISQLYLQNNHGYAKKVHEEIAEVLKNTPNSIRKLEEQTYHLNRCQAYFQLKEAISSIENFLLLFNPNNKFELCRYWQILEQKGFDPASEYTKAIEGFELHYRPNPEDTFMIILQVSRFLKEFSDFETAVTPDFRHPSIKGGKEIKEIGLRREIKKMGMYLSENWEDDDDKADDLEELEHELSKEFPDYSEQMLRDLVNQIYESTKKRREEEMKKTGLNTTSSHTQDVVVDGSSSYRGDGSSPGKKVQKKKDPPILNAIESLNVDIPENRERFRDYYIQKKEKNQDGEEAKKKKEKYLDEEDSQSPQQQGEDGQRRISSMEFSGQRRANRMLTDIKRASQLALEDEKTETYTVQLIEMEEEFQPKFYYYKRWLWMMFPWVCLSFKMNYSRIIFECFSSPTKYISVPDEREKTRQALKIAIEAKIKKQAVLAKPKTNESSSSPSKNSKLDLASPSKGRKMLPPITNNPSTPSLPKDMTINLSTVRPNTLDESGHLSANRSRESYTLTSKKDKDKKKMHHFFITNEFMDTSNFNSTLSLTNGQESTIRDLSGSLTTRDRPSHAMIKEKSLFASEKRFENSLQKSGDALKALMLPKYQDSVLDYGSKNIQELDGKVQELHLRLNDIIFRNKLSAKKLKDLAVIEGNLSQTGAADADEKAHARAAELSEQIEKAQIVREETMKAKVRLESIIHLCLKNKKDDELHIRSLNYLLNSFNKMINSERQATYEVLTQATELEKLAQQFTKAHADKMETQELMIQHIRSEKQKTRDLNTHVTEVYTNLERSAADTVDNLKKTAQINREREEEKVLKATAAKQQTLTNKEELDEKRSLMEQVETQIGLDFEAPKFKEFVDYVEKVNEFEAGIYQVNGDIAKLKEQIAMESSHLQTLRKAKDAPRAERAVHKSAYAAVNNKDELQKTLVTKKKKADELSRVIMNNTKLVLESRMFLSKICGQTGTEFDRDNLMSAGFPVEKITASLQDKLKALEQVMGAEAYEQFKNGKLDVNGYMKKAEGNKVVESQVDNTEKSIDSPPVSKQSKK